MFKPLTSTKTNYKWLISKETTRSRLLSGLHLHRDSRLLFCIDFWWLKLHCVVTMETWITRVASGLHSASTYSQGFLNPHARHQVFYSVKWCWWKVISFPPFSFWLKRTWPVQPLVWTYTFQFKLPLSAVADAGCPSHTAFSVLRQDWSRWSFWPQRSSHQHGDWGWQANPAWYWDILQHHRRGDANECGWSYLEDSTHPSSTPFILEVKHCFLLDLNSTNILWLNSTPTFYSTF